MCWEFLFKGVATCRKTEATVKREFIKNSRRATFFNKPIHVIGSAAKLLNAEMMYEVIF